MKTILNDQTSPISGGRYALKVSGALDLQWKLGDEAFSTIEDGGFTVATDVVIDLPECEIKIINASSNSLTFGYVKSR